MKKLFILFAICVSMMAGAQDTVNNFYINDNAILWSKKYPCAKSFNEAYLLFRISGEFMTIDTAGNKMFAELRQLDADYKGAGFALMNTPIYISGGHINGFAVMSLKDSVFEIVIKKISIEQAYSAGSTRDLFHLEKGEKTDLEVYAINKNKSKFRDSFKVGPKILDYSFNKKFQSLIK